MSETYLEAGGRRFSLASGQSWAIGRGDGCAIMLDSRSVSRLHALIQRRDAGDYSLVDLGSRNGSFVNGARVTIPVVLKDGDRLVLGDQELLFHSANRTPSQAAVAVDDRDAPTTQMHTNSLATILVVDIRDYTPLARTVSESLLSQTIGTWFLKVGQVTQRQGSWAQKYIGDAVMAVWIHDHPSLMQTDLMKTLHAVHEINQATNEISRALPLPGPLRIGAGVNTGYAILGGTEYTALGDTVNTAFRLEAATKTMGLGVALGERSFTELKMANNCHFLRREVALKGYEALKVAWGISFEELEAFLAQSA
jgi:adenylate cyclase